MSDERATELKGCPFCGGTNILAEYDGDGQAWHVCRSCAAEGPVVHKRGDEYDPDWNTRPIEDALRAENEQLKRDLDGMTAIARSATSRVLERNARMEELHAQVSELTRLLGEIEARVADLNRYGGSGPGFGGICQRHDGRYVLLEDVLAMVRDLQSGEGGK